MTPWTVRDPMVVCALSHTLLELTSPLEMFITSSCAVEPRLRTQVASYVVYSTVPRWFMLFVLSTTTVVSSYEICVASSEPLVH